SSGSDGACRDPARPAGPSRRDGPCRRPAVARRRLGGDGSVRSRVDGRVRLPSPPVPDELRPRDLRPVPVAPVARPCPVREPPRPHAARRPLLAGGHALDSPLLARPRCAWAAGAAVGRPGPDGTRAVRARATYRRRAEARGDSGGPVARLTLDDDR